METSRLAEGVIALKLVTVGAVASTLTKAGEL
jgi:hypothetical protein